MTAIEQEVSIVTARVNEIEVELVAGSTVLDACRAVGADIPTLCHGPTMTAANACRVCVVEVEGSRTLVPSCSRTLDEGMEINTESDRALHSRRLVMELLGSASELDRAGDRLATWMTAAGATPTRFGSPEPETPRNPPVPGHHHPPRVDISATVAEPVKIEDDLYVRDYSRCILCYRCVDACGVEHQNTFAIAVAGRGFDARISTEFDVALPESACVYCGNCIAVCPTGALVGKIEFDMRVSGTWDETRQEVTRTVCSYCGVGCNLDLHTQDGRIVNVTSPHDHDVTLGNLCVKGRFGWQYVSSGND
ncbi:MAG TPA: 2Fe-2S iron-sulfur cluster-binding protein [Acidimicrobiia bacterium]|nr:2Fe-2S iron-sulfur cluster-binding protein [Acidimicrobiia bacterium]